MQGSEFNRCLTEEDKRIGFQQGYRAVAERLRSEISVEGSNNEWPGMFLQTISLVCAQG
jgi:hypothetical protein